MCFLQMLKYILKIFKITTLMKFHVTYRRIQRLGTWAPACRWNQLAQFVPTSPHQLSASYNQATSRGDDGWDYLP